VEKLFSWLLYTLGVFSLGVLGAFVYIEKIWLTEASVYVNITDFEGAEVVIERDIDGYSSEWEMIKLDAIPTIRTKLKESVYSIDQCSGEDDERK